MSNYIRPFEKTLETNDDIGTKFSTGIIERNKGIFT